jgi:hypothetical protein
MGPADYCALGEDFMVGFKACLSFTHALQSLSTLTKLHLYDVQLVKTLFLSTAVYWPHLR